MNNNGVAADFSPALPLVLRWLPVWRRHYRVWLKLVGPAILGNFGEPLLYLLALGYGLGTFIGTIGGLPYLMFLASGMVCSSAMNTASFEGLYSAFTRMDVQKTWDAMLATPLSVPDIVIGEATWAATKGLISSVAIMVVAALLGSVADGWALLALPVIFLTGLCFAAMALVVTACAKNYDFFMYYNTLLMTPMMLLSSVFFPLQEMPMAIQWLAWLLPLIHAVELVRPLMTGLPLEQPGLHLVVLAGYSAAFLALAIRLCKRRLLA